MIVCDRRDRLLGCSDILFADHFSPRKASGTIAIFKDFSYRIMAVNTALMFNNICKAKVDCSLVDLRISSGVFTFLSEFIYFFYCILKYWRSTGLKKTGQVRKFVLKKRQQYN